MDKREMTIIDSSMFRRSHRLIEMHRVLFGHLPQEGDPELTVLEYAQRLKEHFKDKMPTLKEAELYYEANRIIEEQEAKDEKTP